MSPTQGQELVTAGNQAFSSRKLSFRELLLKSLLRWPLFLTLILLSGMAAWLYLQKKVPLYETTATLLIKDEKKGNDEAKVLEALNVFSSKKIVENEIEVLKSKTLIQDVVKSLHLYAPIFTDEKFTGFPAYLTSPVEIVAKEPDLIQKSEKQFFDYDPADKKVILNKTEYALNSWIRTPQGTIRFVANPRFRGVHGVKPLYFTLVSVKKAANDIIDRLDVTAASKLSTVIDLRILDEVPQRGENILNKLVEAYNKATLNDKNILAANTLAFVEDRLNVVGQDLDSIEKRLQQFKARNNIVDISTQGKMFLENVGANDQKISGMSMQLAILNQVENYVLGKGIKGGIVPSTVGLSDPVLSDLLEKLYNAELEYEKVKKIAPENNPMLVSLADQINKIKPNILENIQNQRRNLEAGKSDLSGTNNKYVSLLQSLPGKERELLEISRQQNIKNSIFTFLLQKREEAALSTAASVGDSRLVDQAQSSETPVSPQKPLVYSVALFSALVAGLGFLGIRDMASQTIENQDEIKRYTRIPVVGEIVSSNAKDPVVVKKEKRSLAAEQFRQLRTTLSHIGIHSGKKKILITSSISGEGKSFICINLGLSLALTNRKVVLLEMDLRKPKMADYLGVAYTPGITDYLQGQHTVAEIIKSTAVSDNLFLIPTGALPDNPAELLTSKKIEELFACLDNYFDYIIIDSSPVAPVTDAYILSPLCDATLYVVRQGVTPRPLIRKLDEDFQTRGLKNPAIIINGIKGTEKYNYGYSYSYNYVNGNKKSILKKARVV